MNKANNRRLQVSRRYLFLLILSFGALLALLLLRSHTRSVSSREQSITGAILLNNNSNPGTISLTPNRSNQDVVTVDNTVFPSNYVIGRGVDISDIDVNQLLTLTNQERLKINIGLLAFNPKLTLAAQSKCQDMIAKNYWSHYSPDGTAPWTFDVNEGYRYQKLGENLAVGFFDAQTTINGWMASTEHRTNLLDPAFSDVGFAVCKSEKFAGTHNQAALIIVQHLGKPL
jgi:uncharacterized protein YkwD